MAESGKAGKALWPCVEQFDEVFVVQIWQPPQRNNAVYNAASPVFLQKFVHGLSEQGDWQLHAHVSKIALETGIAGDVVQAEIRHGGRG